MTSPQMTTVSDDERRDALVGRLFQAALSVLDVAAIYVGDRLGLSLRTVETHLTSIYAKIGARGRADAVAFALRHGILPP